MQRLFVSLTGAVLALSSIAAWVSVTEPVEEPAKPRFANHVWVDRLPKDARDRVRVLVPVRKGARTVGVAHHSSRYSVHAERFTFGRKEGKLELRFLQTRTKKRVDARVWRCEGRAPKPFQLCLELRDGGRRHMLYSRDDWDPRQGPDILTRLGVEAPEGAVGVDRCHDCRPGRVEWMDGW